MKTVDVYLHGDRQSMYEAGEKLGLTGEALRMFSFACYEVRVTLDVEEDGKATIRAIDGRVVAS